MEEVPNAEMRCFQMSKGGMRYDLIVLPVSVKCTKRSFPVPRSRTLSLVDIQRKQDQAAVRRLYQRSSRIPSQHLNHIAEVRENRRKSISDFRHTVKKETEQKMWNCEINRKNRIKSVQVINFNDHL